MSNIQYSKEQLVDAYQQLEQELQTTKQNQAVSQASVGSLSPYQNSIVEWQLDLSKEFELIHHQLRGHIIKRDGKGNEFWAKSPDPEQQLLNEKGAQEVEKIIRNYLNKNTLLSCFDEVLIKKRVGEFAHRLRRFIYLNYEEFGLDNYYKQKHFEMLVMNIVDMIESAYYRALDGGERQSLTTVRQIVQHENMTSTQQGMPSFTDKGGSKLNPVNWFR